MENYVVEKWVWTEEDFENMGWHDATIHAFAFFPEMYEFAIDMDYIFQWIPPPDEATYFNFWVAPVTLVFGNINELTIDIELFDNVQLQDIVRGESREPKNAAYIERQIEWSWLIDSNVGEINLWSVGYRMFVRKMPQLVQKQNLNLDERGDISFYRGNFSTDNHGS